MTSLTPQSAPQAAANYVQQAIEILELLGTNPARDIATDLMLLKGEIRELKADRFHGKKYAEGKTQPSNVRLVGTLGSH